MEEAARRVVVVSNRLPVALELGEGGRATIRPTIGGLAAALAPVLKRCGGLWIGWPGTTAKADLGPHIRSFSDDVGFSIHPVSLDAGDVDGYYHGFSNQVIWPLFHDLQTFCDFDSRYWRAYREVNLKFARAAAESSRAGDFVWVHDYHLMTMGAEMRRMGLEPAAGFFLHIPFPPADLFLKLPWRSELMEALLDYQLIGLQTRRDLGNFIETVRALYPRARVGGGEALSSVAVESRVVHAGAFPISIDFEAVSAKASTVEVGAIADSLRESFPGQQVMIGADRLDYTKGIPQRLEAFRLALERFPELRGGLTLIQAVAPSRTDVPRYRALKKRIEQLVGEINGRFTRPGWVPIHYLFQGLDLETLYAHYRASGMALITPLKDGMNLAAKEYCACNVEQNGVLILSEFAGAATQLHRDALLVNPYDLDGTAEAIYRGFRMAAEERKKRMTGLRETIRRNDIYRWVDDFLGAAATG